MRTIRVIILFAVIISQARAGTDVDWSKWDREIQRLREILGPDVHRSLIESYTLLEIEWISEARLSGSWTSKQERFRSAIGKLKAEDLIALARIKLRVQSNQRLIAALEMQNELIVKLGLRLPNDKEQKAIMDAQRLIEEMSLRSLER